MNIDKIRKLSLEYAKGNFAPPVHRQHKRRKRKILRARLLNHPVVEVGLPGLSGLPVDRDESIAPWEE